MANCQCVTAGRVSRVSRERVRILLPQAAADRETTRSLPVVAFDNDRLLTLLASRKSC